VDSISQRDVTSITVNWLFALFTSAPSVIAFDGVTLGFGDPAALTWSVEDIGNVSLSRGWLWATIEFTDRSGTTRRIGGISPRAALAMKRAVDTALRPRLDALRQELDEYERSIEQYLSGARYARHSEGLSLQSRVDGVLRDLLVRPDNLDAGCLEKAQELQLKVERKAFAKARERANRGYVERESSLFQEAHQGALSWPLSAEQAEAVVTGEDCTLVLAGAGTGKTAVILAKVMHLLMREHVPPNEILVLAFNRRAAEEVGERLRAAQASSGIPFAGVHVSTFNALGNRLIGELGQRKPSVSSIASDNDAYHRLVQGFVDALLVTPEFQHRMVEFLAYHLVPVESDTDYERVGDYVRAVRREERRTLQGELVKSDGELHVANFLWLNQVPYRYEDPYVVPTADKNYSQYRPDFHLFEARHSLGEDGQEALRDDAWLEHFALRRDGSSVFGHDYVQGVHWKRSLHARNRSTLLETYSWQVSRHSHSELLRALATQLGKVGIELEPRPASEAVAAVRPAAISRLAHLLCSFIRVYKGGNWTLERLRARIDEVGDERADAFAAVFAEVFHRYESYLTERGEVDFDDQINMAASLLKSQRGPRKYRDVLVDEFQDISSSRLRLLQALSDGHTRYFVVGDDWQSIYRFAGSDIGIISSLPDHLGQTAQLNLRQTFRFGASILGPTSLFVRTNPAQSQRELLPSPGVIDEGITVICRSDFAVGVSEALAEIAERSQSSRPSVLVLGRYRITGDRLEPLASDRFEFRTIHSAKGSEADYVIVVDLENSAHGFPAQQEDDPLLALILPEAEQFPFAEERRLFYVALTRARRGIFLITNPERPSLFIAELMRIDPSIGHNGAHGLGEVLSCPACDSGILKESRSRKTMHCSNFPVCDYLAHACAACSAGYVVMRSGRVVCTNGECAGAEVCPRCLRGTLTLRAGRHGPFWGCTGYTSVPPCEFTRASRGDETSMSANP
jgi:DNA helicase-4